MILSPAFDQPELLARVKSLLRSKTYYDTIQSQADGISGLESLAGTRVQQQVDDSSA